MKSFIILGLLAAFLAFVAGLDYDKGISEINEAFPGINVVSPEVIKVVFDNGAFLDLGKNITPTESKNQPDVDWNADKDAYYTLLVAGPDGPSQKDPFLRDVVHWLAGNIPGKDINAADVIAEYVGAAPPRNMGANRLFFLVYRQPKKLEFDEKRANKNTVEGRFYFSSLDFAKKYNLGSPIGVNFLTAFFDPQTEVVYKQVNCCQQYL